MRVFTISDIHADYRENLLKIKNISQSDYKNDTLIVAGDISSKLKLISEVSIILKSKFKSVFFVAGNHDLWLEDRNQLSSFQKYAELTKVLTEEGIETKPYRIDNLVLIPIPSWYDYSFNFPKTVDCKNWSDSTRCKWPFSVELITAFFLSLSNTVTPLEDDYVITYSHFLPRIDFLPEKLILHIPHIVPFLGSTLIDEKIRGFGTKIHVFGHLHYNFSLMKDSVLYVNNSLGYPHEYRANESLLVQLL